MTDEPAVDRVAAREFGDAFWAFSLKLYGAPGAPDICLSLQNAHGGDVNLALFCLWSGVAAGRLTDATLTDAVTRAEAYRARVVAPLRAIRTEMKRGPASPGIEPGAWEDVRRAVKRLELTAEEAQQRAMAPLARAATPPPGAPAAAANVERYAALAGLDAPGALWDALVDRAAQAVDLGAPSA